MRNHPNRYRDYIACMQIAKQLYAAKLLSSEDYSRMTQIIRQRYMPDHKLLVKKPQAETTGLSARVE